MIPELRAVIYDDVHVIYILPKESNYIIAFSNYDQILDWWKWVILK